MGLNNDNISTNHTPIYNDFWASVGTTFTAPLPPNYRFVADVYVNDVFVTRMKTFPNKQEFGVFRLNRVLEDYVSYDFATKADIGEPFFGNCNSIKNVYCVFFEEYGSLSTGTTIFTATSITGATSIFYNGAISYLGDYKQNYDKDVFQPNSLGGNRGPKTFIKSSNTFRNNLATTAFAPLGGQFLTNAPRVLTMDYSDMYFVDIFNVIPSGISYLQVITFDNTNTQLSSATYANSSYIDPNLSGVTMCNDKISVGIGPHNINTVQSSFSTVPIINQDVAYYTCATYFTDGVNPDIRTSEIYRVNITNKKYYDKFRFAWLNNYGSWDRYSFEGRHQQTKTAVNTTEYKQLLGDTTNTTTLSYLNPKGRDIIYQNVQNSYTVNSQFITEDEAYWLNELYNSTTVYLEITPKVNRFIATENVGGLLKLIFAEPHYMEDGDFVVILDCLDSNNNQYSSITVEDPFTCLVATSFFSSTNGYCHWLAKLHTEIPIIIDSKNYLIKQAISPRNISVELSFTTSIDDPKQRGGKDI
jgi:hypothetical protein